MKSAEKRAEDRITGIKKRLEAIRSERENITALDDIKKLRSIAASYDRQSAKEPLSDIDRPFPRRFRSLSGLEIIVGRNDRENDELIRWAGKNDFWLHAQ